MSNNKQEEENKNSSDQVNEKDEKETELDNENQEDKQVPDLDIEELMKELQKLEEMKNNSGNKDGKKKKMPKMITVEFGGVFHPNMIINTVFYFILNLAIMSVLFELLSFAVYQDSLYIIMFVAAYTLVEMMFRIYMMTHHIRIVFKTFGLIFYIGYLFIFYVLDSFVFDRYLYFLHETLLVVFVAIFALIRYVISYYIRQNFRKRNLR